MTEFPTSKSDPIEKLINTDSIAKLPPLHLGVSPHVRHKESVPQVMLWVVIALIPALIASVIFFGVRALFITIICMLTAVVTEALINNLQKKPLTIGDFSALITGILLAFNLPPAIPWWMAVIGSAFAVGVAKMVFGGLGSNFINPALAGRAFLMASYPAAMTTWSLTRMGSLSGFDGITSATPLGYLSSETISSLNLTDALPNLFFGNVGGCIGETSALALLIGAAVLLFKRIIGVAIPLVYIATVFILFWLFNGTGNLFTLNSILIPTYHILAGGLILGAFFMATDMVTSPITPVGKIVFGLGCGLLTFAIRKFGGYPEGVSYSILLMNLLVPLIDRYTRPTIYGEVKKRD